MNLASEPEKLEFIVYRDFDDDSDYLESSKIRYLRGNLKDLPEMYNLCAKAALGDIYFLAADDIQIRTENWDKIIESTFEKFQDPFLGVHGDDLGQNPIKIGTHFFVSSKWFTTLRFIFPLISGFRASDVWMTSLFDSINKRVIIKDLHIEHFHPSWGKSQLDATYKEKFLKENLEEELNYNAGRIYEVTEFVISKLKESADWRNSTFISPLVVNLNLLEEKYEDQNIFYMRYLNFARWKMIKLKLFFFKIIQKLSH